VLADSGSQYTAGPIAAVVVVCLLAMLLRWVFGRRRPRSARYRSRPTLPPDAGPAAYGLLRPVALLPGRAEGDSLRAVLSAAGIRSTLSAGPDGQVEVLVFAADADRARSLLPPP
jgi:hypothetical protein